MIRENITEFLNALTLLIKPNPEAQKIRLKAKKSRTEKKILKNSEYNYQTFLAKDLEAKDLEKFEINAKQPKTLLINGLSLFLSKEERLIVKVVNKDIVLFKAIDKEKNYSESGIIDRKSGELIHEITKKLKSENSEKDISFYSCSENEKKV